MEKTVNVKKRNQKSTLLLIHEPTKLSYLTQFRGKFLVGRAVVS